MSGAPSPEATSPILAGEALGTLAHLYEPEVLLVSAPIPPGDAPPSEARLLAASDADRSRLGHAGGSDDAQPSLVLDWQRLQRAEHGALTVFKGTA